MSRKYEDREELDAAIEQVASQIEDKDVADHIRENASGTTGRLWLPAVYSESNNYLRRKIVAELGSSEPSGYMSEEHGWSLESWL